MGRIDPEAYLDEGSGDYRWRRREARRQRRARRAPTGDEAYLEDLIKHGQPGPEETDADFIPTLSASHWERWWIYNYLGRFYHDKLITDVLRRVKGGKEATVYCCAAHPATGLELIAAKVYRPRIFRQLRNDARYRQGRHILDGEGKVVRDRRHLRAVRQGTRTGKDLQHTSWLAHEVKSLEVLYEAGVEVPRPLAHDENVILMEYVGDLGRPAPTLNQVRLAPGEAQPLFEQLLANVELMLACRRVHGDLSAYNVLYWEGGFRIIDFPQAIDPGHHREAFAIFQRDMERLCAYFSRRGVASDPVELAAELWSRHCGP